MFLMQATAQSTFTLPKGTSTSASTAMQPLKMRRHQQKVLEAAEASETRRPPMKAATGTGYTHLPRCFHSSDVTVRQLLVLFIAIAQFRVVAHGGEDVLGRPLALRAA